MTFLIVVVLRRESAAKTCNDDDQNHADAPMTAAFRQCFGALGSRSLIWPSILGSVSACVRVSPERLSNSLAIRLVRSIVSAPRQSFNVLGMVGIVCERLSEDRHCDVNASIEFHDGIVRQRICRITWRVTILPCRSTRIRRIWKGCSRSRAFADPAFAGAVRWRRVHRLGR